VTNYNPELYKITRHDLRETMRGHPMIPGALEYGGGRPITLPPDGFSCRFDALDIFEIFVTQAAAALYS